MQDIIFVAMNVFCLVIGLATGWSMARDRFKWRDYIKGFDEGLTAGYEAGKRFAEWNAEELPGVVGDNELPF